MIASPVPDIERMQSYDDFASDLEDLGLEDREALEREAAVRAGFEDEGVDGELARAAEEMARDEG